MKCKFRLSLVIVLLFSIFAITLIACSGSSSTAPSSGSVSGTAATGTAIAGATVTLVDSKGTTLTGTTGSNGSFTITGTINLTPPFMLKVQTGGITLYSVSADANTTTTINITPLTDIIIRTWYTSQGISIITAFGNPVSYPPPTPNQVQVISSSVMSIMRSALQLAGIDATTFNLISTPFAGGPGSGFDGVLDQTTITLNANGTFSIAVLTSYGTITSSKSKVATASGTATQNSALAAASGTVTVTTSQTTDIGTTSSVATTTIVPTDNTQSDALAGIITTMNNLYNTINQKGSQLSASDLTPYYDPDFLYNGIDLNYNITWMLNHYTGLTLSYSELQLNSLDAVNNIAEVTYQITETKPNGGGSMTYPTVQLFKLTNGSWLYAGNQKVAAASITPMAYDSYASGKSTYMQYVGLKVTDPQQNNVQSVTVSGPGITGSVTVPVVCSYNPVDCNGGNCPLCENAYGWDGWWAQKFFLNILPPSYWPTTSTTYTFTLTTATGGPYTYTSTISPDNAFGYSQGQVVAADYPMPLTLNNGTPTLSQILGGITLTGSVYVPPWNNSPSTPYFLYYYSDPPNGPRNSVNNAAIWGTWDAGFAVLGAMNNFTITIPAATVNSSYTCSTGTGTCYNITFQGQTGNVSIGQFYYYPCLSRPNGTASSCTYVAVQIH